MLESYTLIESNASVDVLLADIIVVVTVVLAVKGVDLNSVPADNGFAKEDALRSDDRVVWLVVVLADKCVWEVVVLVEKVVGLVVVLKCTVVGITFVLTDNGVDLDSVLTYGFAVDGVLTDTVVDLIASLVSYLVAGPFLPIQIRDQTHLNDTRVHGVAEGILKL